MPQLIHKKYAQQAGDKIPLDAERGYQVEYEICLLYTSDAADE